MRDFLLNEALNRLATEAATRLATLVAAGEEIPFDVAADAGEDSPFYSYVPLTGRYVREHAGELRALPSFAAAREAAVEAGVAAPYLEARGEAVPADPGARAERMLTVFFASLWEGCSALRPRPRAARGGDRDPRRGSARRRRGRGRDRPDRRPADVGAALSLPHGVRIVRADSIEAPIEAMRSEGMGRAAWEPQYLAVAEQDPEHGAEGAVQQLRELISVMRLFKGGGIGLGPYAFAPTGADTWRRIPTAAAATRPGGYRLSESEAAALAEFADHAGVPPRPRRRPHLGGRPLRDGLRARKPDGRAERPPAGDARGARGPRPGRRLAADARRGADRRATARWTGSKPASGSSRRWSWSGRR